MIFLIQAIHAVLILSVAIAPLVPNRQYKIYALTFLLYLAFQHATGYQRCGLTDLEYILLGKQYQSGFLYRLINPLVSCANETCFDKYLHIVHLLYIIILFITV
jgi:hypothetical protein